jgi:GxxExxY protein
LESVYENVLAHELSLRGIVFERQRELSVHYKNAVVGEFRTDMLIDGKIVVELKAIKTLTEIDEAQLLNYLMGRGVLDA